MKNTETFVSIGSAAERVVENARRAMLARQAKEYRAPATEADKRLTRRICGERDDD